MTLASLPASSLGSVLFSIKPSVESLDPVPGNTICFFDTFFSDATRLPRQISQGFIPECDDIIIMEQEETNHQGYAPFAISADPSFHPSGMSCRRGDDQLAVVAKKDTRHAAATVDDESATWRRTRGSYLTSRSFDCYACCRVPHRGFCQCVLLRLGPLQITGIPSGK